jgi:shikimate dehydrogenase
MTSSPTSFLIGLIGAGIQASRAPAMHEGEGAEQRLHYVYRLIDLDQLSVGVEALYRPRKSGPSVFRWRLWRCV